MSYVRRIRSYLNSVIENPDILKTDPILPADFEAISSTHDLFVRSAFMGMDHAVSGKNLKNTSVHFADTFPVEVLPFEEAVSYLQSKIPLNKKDYYALDDELRFRAFTVGRLNDADAITNVKSILDRGLKEGTTLKTFLDQTDDEILDGAGFGKGNMSYWENVYRTNVQTCYNTGRAMGFEAVPPIALELVGVEDLRQSEICRELTNPPFIRPYKDPVWESFWPPFHFSCRTTIRGIYDQAEIDDLGGEDKAYGPLRDASAQKGFGGYPLDKESYWRLTPEMIERAQKYGIDGDIIKSAFELDMKSYGFDLLKGYQINLSTKSGGALKVASNSDHVDQELAAARDLAEQGHEVYLLPRSRAAKSADMIIDGEIGEIKHQVNSGSSSISSLVREAGREQRSRIVSLHVLPETTQEEIQTGVWKEINRTPITKIILEWKGSVWELPRDLMMKKDWSLP